tara:strand:+ start:4940 stop:6172 length:1233 start_codon:yes stop_codon:yes gene_type:complete
MKGAYIMSVTKCLIALCTIALIASQTLTAVTAQALPDPPRSDRQPSSPSTPRVMPLPESEWTAVHRDLITKYTGDGQADNQLRTLLNVPAIVEGLMPLTVYLLEDSELSPRERHLLILRTAWLTGSQPIWATQAARARTSVFTSEQIQHIAEGPSAPSWSRTEQTLLETADQLFLNSSVTDETWTALSAHYNLFRLMEIVETVNHFTVLAMIYNSFGVQPDSDTPDRLPSNVPYQIIVPKREPWLTEARVLPLEGDGIAVSRTFGQHPNLAQPRSRRANFINRVSNLTPHDREILILRIGWDCQAVYEWAKHVGTVGRARDHGVDPTAVAEGPNASNVPELNALLLRTVDELYQNTSISDATWDALTAEYTLADAMSAVYTPSSYRATSMSLNTYGVQLEAGDESFPDVR